MHDDAVRKGQRVLIVDDLLATGGTAKATLDLVTQLGGHVHALAFLIELVGAQRTASAWPARLSHRPQVPDGTTLILLLSAAIVVAAVLIGAAQIVREMRAAREQAAHSRGLAIVQLFAPALAAVQDDPRALLVWQPLARAVRQLFPLESAAIDRASGGAFPFGREMMTAAHARWTSDWLAWERTHDTEYKLKAAVAAGGARGGRRRDGRARPARSARAREAGALPAPLRGIHARRQGAPDAGDHGNRDASGASPVTTARNR